MLVCQTRKACHSGYGKVDEDAVYECTGSPHPKQIAEIVESMMNDEFQTSFKRMTPLVSTSSSLLITNVITIPYSHCALCLFLAGIQDIKINYGLALQDIISGIYDYLRTIVFEKHAQIYLLDQLSQIELSNGFLYLFPDPCAVTFFFFLSFLNLFIFVEYRHRLSTGATEKIQLSSLLGSFRIAVEITSKSQVA
jgi:replication factor C subunit 3/5